MLIRDIVRRMPEARLVGADDVEIADIVYDSRRVNQGSLFVAVPKVGGDAHSGGFQHVDQAIRDGASAIVTQVAGFTAPIPVIAVHDARAAMADVAGVFYGEPSHCLSVFAVTGTDGKTTTTYLLDGIFSRAGLKTGLIGTVETKIGNERSFNADRMTTPESPDVQRLFRTMADAGVTHVAMEASSHALTLQRLRGTLLAACAVTNITADHLDFHGDWEAYFAAKASLFSHLGRGSPAILNRDDESYERLAELASGEVLSYGFNLNAQVRAGHVETGRGAVRFILSIDGDSAPVMLPMSGAFNVSNALAAAGLAHAAGTPLEIIARGLSEANPPPGRMQRVAAGQGFEVLVDYAHTPNAFRTVLADVRGRSDTGSRILAVFGATGNRDRSKRPLLARIARQYADYFFITNEDPFGEDPASIIAEVAAGADAGEEGKRFECEPDRRRAIQKALGLARPGDTVVILGKGHERSIVAEGRRASWNDADTVRELLASPR